MNPAPLLAETAEIRRFHELSVYKAEGIMILSLGESMIFSSAPCQKWPTDQKEVYK